MCDTTEKGLSTKTNITTKCVVCGSDVTQNSTGRFKDYCSPNCREFNKYKSAFLTALDKIEFKDYSYIKMIKGDLFRVVNCMPKGLNNV